MEVQPKSDLQNNTNVGAEPDCCYCEGTGTLISCSQCKLRAHRECIDNITDNIWICDFCKNREITQEIPKCFLCCGNDKSLLFFKLSSSVWCHGKCLSTFYQYIITQKSNAHNVSINRCKEIKDGEIHIDLSTFIEELKKDEPFFYSTVGSQLKNMRLFLSRILPSSSICIDLINSSPCFYCHIMGGFVIKCNSTNCIYSYHPICFQRSSHTVHLIKDIAEAGIACPTHRGSAPCMKRPRGKGPKADSAVISSTPTTPIGTPAAQRKPASFGTPITATRTPSCSPATQTKPLTPGSTNQHVSSRGMPKRLSKEPANKSKGPADINNANKTAVPLSPMVEDSQASVAESTEGVDDEVCDLCTMGYSDPGDMLVFCDKCNVAVHQGCYGIAEVPEGEWLCCACRHGFDSREMRCILCHQKGGAFALTEEGQFVHMLCGLYLPELSVNISGPDPIVCGLHRISKERALLRCTLCQQVGGGCAQCAYHKCNMPMHPYCAMKQGCLMTVDEKYGSVNYCIYCPMHTRVKEEKEKRKEEMAAGLTPSEVTPIKLKKRVYRRKKTNDKPKAVSDIVNGDTMSHTRFEEKDRPLFCSDFWSYMSRIYTIKPALQSLISLFHFLCTSGQLLSTTQETSYTIMLSGKSTWIPSEVVAYSYSVYKQSQFSLTTAAAIEFLKGNPSFLIPPLGTSYRERLEQDSQMKPQTKTVSASPHKTSANTSLHRTQMQRFQGFDIDDFADLRESYECRLDTTFIQWAQDSGICKNTSFRLARHQDIPWLLQINVINPTFSCESDYQGTFREKNEFVILAERTNAAGITVPVGMVHYYLMWYYPCSGKIREAVRAVYVCTLQRVDPTSHASFVLKYGISAESHTGTMLLSLAFLHGQRCHMSMGCCDSTDNSVTFYTSQFDMKALPKGEGRHYTPMQLSLCDFHPRNILMRHVDPTYRGTLLCTLSLPLNDDVPETGNTCPTCLHLRVDKNGCQMTDGSSAVFSQQHQFIREQCKAWLDGTVTQQTTATTSLSTRPPHVITDIGRVCDLFAGNTYVYTIDDVPHFYEVMESPTKETTVCGGLCINHSVYANGDVRLCDSNYVERELERCQADLYKVILSNEHSLAMLVQQLVQQEVTATVTLLLADDSKRLVGELEAYTSLKRPDMAKNVEEDEIDAICDVCGDGDSNFGNMILFCDGCNAAVHQCCYDVTELPKGDWFCNVCEDILVRQLGVRDVLHVTPRDVDASDSQVSNGASCSDTQISPILDRLQEIRCHIFCCICGYSKGAMMPTLVKGVYAHVCCSLWHPFVRVSNTFPQSADPELIPVWGDRDTADNAVISSSAPAEETTSSQHCSDETVLIPLVTPSQQQVAVSNSIVPTPLAISYQPSSLTPSPAISESTVEIPLSVTSESITTMEASTARVTPPLMRYEIYESPYRVLRSNIDRHRYLVDITSLDSQGKTLTCQLCRHRGGVVPCCISGCSRGVHVTCALKYELEMFWNNKAGHSGIPIEDVLQEKDFFIHCFQHSGGFQGREVPRKRPEMYQSPLGDTDETSSVGRRNKKESHRTSSVPRGRKPRKVSTDGEEELRRQGLERVRAKRQRKQKKREQAMLRPPRVSRATENEMLMVFTRKARSTQEKKQREVFDWMRRSEGAKLLVDDEKNLLLKIQSCITRNELPRYANWKGYNVDNATIRSFYRRCNKRAFSSPYEMVTEIREIYLSLLSYSFPSNSSIENEVAKTILKDAKELSKLMISLRNPEILRKLEAHPDRMYCVCVTDDGDSDFMVGCDECGEWYHPSCIGFSEDKYVGFLSTYRGYYVDIREGHGSFYCPLCCNEESFKKMSILTESEVIAAGGQILAGYEEREIVPIVSFDGCSAVTEGSEIESIVSTLEIPADIAVKRDLEEPCVESEEKRVKYST